MALPLVDVTEADLNGYLFVNFPTEDSLKRSRMKLELRIISDVENEINDIIKYKRWGEYADYEGEEIEEYRKERSVISKWTLWRACSYERRQLLKTLTRQQIEAEVLKMYPGKFKARYKENEHIQYIGDNDIFYYVVKELMEERPPDDEF